MTCYNSGMSEMAKLPAYLFRRGPRGTFHFRRPIQPELRDLLGKREFTESLKTTDQAKAMPRYAELVMETDAAIRKAQAQHAAGVATPVPGPSPAIDLAALVDRISEAVVSGEQARRAEVTKSALADERAFWRGEVIEIPLDLEDEFGVFIKRGWNPNAPPTNKPPKRAHSVRTALARLYDREIDDRIRHLNAILAIGDVDAIRGRYRGLPADLGLPTLTALIRAEIEALCTLAAAPEPISAPNVAAKTAQPLATTATQALKSQRPPSATDDNPLMSVAIGRWIKAMVREAQWKPRYAKDNRQVALDFVQVVGDKPLRTYTRADGRSFKDFYELVPSHMDKRKNKLGVGWRDVRALAQAAQAKGFAPLHLNTLNQKFTRLGQFFRWAQDQFSVDIINPVERLLRLSKKKLSAANKEKSPYTMDELKAVFSAPVFTGCKSNYHWKKPGDLILRNSSRYWVPLIGAFTGMRLGEICQLRRGDVRRHEDLDYFLLLSPGMRLKNEHSNRAVPMHTMLVGMGLLDFVANCKERLFPDVPIDELDDEDSPSSVYSKRYSNFLTALGIKRSGLDFHSFRHTFVKVARQCRLDPEARERMIGHVIEGEAGRYGDDYRAEAEDMELLKVRAAEMAKIEFRGLDLSHLLVT
jgi:integrase